MDHEAKNEKQVLCKGCGKAFSMFLHGMAEHNAKVVCPECKKVYDRSEAAQLPSPPRKTRKSGN
jgi:endogenous inhibitor of DNA gyrase (YacG/DUF329 family)